MEFVTGIGDRELETLAWLLKTKTKVHNVEFYKGIALSVVVLAVTGYNICFYDASTTAQKWILCILSAVCIAKTVLCKIGKIDYLTIAKQKNKKKRNKEVICIFEHDRVIVKNGNQVEDFRYMDLKEWGEYQQCIYLLFHNGAAVVINKEEQMKEDVEKLKELLYEIAQNGE